MANTLTVGVSVAYSGNNVALNKSASLAVPVTGNASIAGEMVTSTSDTAIPLGPVSGTLGVAYLKNQDSTNAISIKTAVSGTVIATLQPGMFALIPLGSGVTAPSAVAAAGTPVLEYAVFPQ